MRRTVVILVALASLLTGCRSSGVADYWVQNSIDYSDYDAAQDRFAIFAEKAVAANEEDAFAAMDMLFDSLLTDEVAYYIYTEWMDAAFYNPLSPCRNASLYNKAVERIVSDAFFSERESAPFLQHRDWMQYNLVGSKAVAPEILFDGRRTLVLVLDLGCPTCRASLTTLASDHKWADVRRVAIGVGYGPIPDVPGWEYKFPEYANLVFDPGMTPFYFVVAENGTIEETYKLL